MNLELPQNDKLAERLVAALEKLAGISAPSEGRKTVKRPAPAPRIGKRPGRPAIYCRTPGCRDKIRCKGLCSAHYQQARRS